MKKKPQRYSYKKLLSTTRRPQKNNFQDYLERQKQKPPCFNYSSNNHHTKSSSKNKSAQKILSVYDSSRAKFKLGKFLNSNQRQYRIKTEQDEFNKTKSTYHKINSVRKINQQKEDKQLHRHINTSTVKYNTNTTRQFINTNNNNINQNIVMNQNTQNDKIRIPIESTRHRAFNKRLNLNSELFQNLNNSGNSIEKYVAPHTSKHQKKSNFSFRKEHDSYRAINKKTALEKYISESLENLECPTKKKNSKSLNQNKIDAKDSKQKEKTQHKLNLKKDKMFLEIKKSKEKPEFTSPSDKYQNFIIQNKTDEIKESRTIIRSSQEHQQIQQKSNRRLKTQPQDSIEKIEIKWQKKRKNPYDLSNEQMETFGDRFPDGFQKIKLLGRGGFSLVWLGEHKKSKKKYAVKQIITESNHETHKKQIWFGTYFFEFGGIPKQEYTQNPGIKNLVKLYYYFINKKDTWLLYEKCGDSLGNALYELKGQNYNNQKMYRIHYKDFYAHIKLNQDEIRKIVLQVAYALQLLAENNIVHSDLKTENILVQLKNKEESAKTIDAKESGRFKKQNHNSILEQVKLIDYGSSFQFNNLRQFSMATPEYMAPQILNFILYENQLEYIPKLFQYVQQYHDPWVIDVWSLGCVLLQIVSGIPLWMSLKTIVKRKNKELIRYGLFAVKGRTFDKIIRKQLEVVQNLDKFLAEENYSDISLDDDLKYLLKKMLALNPAKRISPGEIIDFLTRKTGDRE